MPFSLFKANFKSDLYRKNGILYSINIFIMRNEKPRYAYFTVSVYTANLTFM